MHKRLDAMVRPQRGGHDRLGGNRYCPVGLAGEVAGQTDLEHLKAFGAISIGTEMEPGDYVLQVIVTDGLSKAKNQTATQYVPFEVVGR